MDFWRTRFLFDDLFFAFVNLFLALKERRNLLLKRNSKFKNIHNGKKAVILLNGPSLPKDLQRKNNSIYFSVNRGFLLPIYNQILPEYHVFVDPKMKEGIWPLSWMNDIKEINRNVHFIVDIGYSNSKKIKNKLSLFEHHYYSGKNYLSPFTRFNVDLTKNNIGLAVFGACLHNAIYMGCKDIDVYGMDGNGFMLEMLSADTHAYGKNSENDLKGFDDRYKDLYMNYRYWRTIERALRFYKKRGISISNKSDTSVILFP